MIDASTLPAVTAALLAAAAGFGGGSLYFAALRRTVSAFADGWQRPLALTAVRLMAAVAGFAAAAQFGPLALLAAFLGFLAARFVAVRNPAGDAA